MTTKTTTHSPSVTDSAPKPLSDSIKEGVCDTKLHSVEDALASLSIIDDHLGYFLSDKLLRDNIRTVEETLIQLGSTRRDELIRMSKKFRMLGRIQEGNTKGNKVKVYFMVLWDALLGRGVQR